MKKLTGGLLLALLLNAGLVYADHDDMGEHCKMHNKMSFEQADKDKDGTLDREEAKLVCDHDFDKMDTDKDGTVSKEELNACGRDAEHAKMHEKRDKEFASADKDADGTLDREEAKKLKNVAKNFDAIDTDKDGTVSRDEVHEFMHQHGKDAKKSKSKNK